MYIYIYMNFQLYHAAIFWCHACQGDLTLPFQDLLDEAGFIVDEYAPQVCGRSGSCQLHFELRKNSLVYVSAAEENRQDGIEHTVVYKMLV